MLEGYEDFDHVLVSKYNRRGQIVKIYRVKPLQLCFYAKIQGFVESKVSPPLKSSESCRAWVDEQLNQ